MPDAANGEQTAAGEASTQQGNVASSSERESSKPRDPLEVSHRNDPGSMEQTKSREGLKKEGK
jgi:hypothetical protein